MLIKNSIEQVFHEPTHRVVPSSRPYPHTADLHHPRAVRKKHRESVTWLSADKLLGRGLAIVVKQQESELVVKGEVVGILGDGPLILHECLLRRFSRGGA